MANPAVDMQGMAIGGWVVVCREENSALGKARWRIRHTCVGAGELVVLGATLRAKAPKYCDACRPAHVKKWGYRYEAAVTDGR